MAASFKTLDRTGVIASVFCAIHCAIAPVLLIAMPTLGGMWSHPVSHFAIAALVLPVAGFALRNGFLTHGRRWVIAVGAIGIGLVLTGAVLPYLTATGVDTATGAASAEGCDQCDQCCPSFIVDEETGEETLHIPPASVVTLFGGASLIVAHLANLRCCSKCRTPAPLG